MYFKLRESFEIHWVVQCLVKCVGQAGIVNQTVYTTEPIFTAGLGMANFPNFNIVNP